MMYYCYLPSPAGELLLAGDGRALHRVGFPAGGARRAPEPGWTFSTGPFSAVMAQLREYFEGSRRRFDLLLAPTGTEFQRRVLEELGRIPYGETATYGEIAHRIGRPRAVRAVGRANGRNPLPIIIPCHRVIGANGKLVGFGGGLKAKETLLALERRHAPARKEAAPA